MKHDTLILCKSLADLGEALKKDCPQNDCIVYRNIYERYNRLYADYARIKEAFADLDEATIGAIEHAIRKSELDLYEMWESNYAVWRYRAAAGMTASKEPPKKKSETVFEAVTKDAATLARLLGALPVLEAPWDTEFQQRYCSKCFRADCDDADECPYQQDRNNPAWWLSLDATGVDL